MGVAIIPDAARPERDPALASRLCSCVSCLRAPRRSSVHAAVRSPVMRPADPLASPPERRHAFRDPRGDEAGSSRCRRSSIVEIRLTRTDARRAGVSATLDFGRTILVSGERMQRQVDASADGCRIPTPGARSCGGEDAEGRLYRQSALPQITVECQRSSCPINAMGADGAAHLPTACGDSRAQRDRGPVPSRHDLRRLDHRVEQHVGAGRRPFLG